MPDIEAIVQKFFSADGPLTRSTGLEYRRQQEEMSAAVLKALASNHHLIIEAPTGVGKTMAYLVPAILIARTKGRKAIISTHTKNLQEQILGKDIPLVRSLLKENFSAAILKGRRNYLCRTRLQRALGSAGSLFGEEENRQLIRINEWSHTTPDGDVENLGFAPRSDVWDMVCSEKGVCSYTSCGSTCFFQQTKERVKGANLVIMNHALFFTLLALQSSEEFFIYENDFVIFDEAHTLESVAGLGTGRKLSRYQVFSTLHRLYNPRTKKGLLARKKKLISEFSLIHDEVEEFFGLLRQAALALVTQSAQREVRLRLPYLTTNTFSHALSRLHRVIEKAATGSSDADQQEFTVVTEQLREAALFTEIFIEQADASLTYWIELGSGENITMWGAPANVAAEVGPRLFREGTSVIMTSATLSVNRNVSFFAERIGADSIESVILDSPFDHARQMKLCLANGIPEPDSPGYLNTLPEWILRSIDRTGGKALVLFTASSLMKLIADKVADELAMRGISLLVQGEELQRHALLEEFKRDVHSVLFGLDSFWMGVDVPGEALQHVIITRLPFSVPNQPIIEARIEEIARRGGNSFMEYTLPEAVLKFKQGFGRLIRSSSDTGIVTILDGRILKKRYGRIFLDSLPRCAIELMDELGELHAAPTDDW